MTGQELTNRIDSLGLSREQIAEELFTTISTIRAWESAKDKEIKNRLVGTAIERLEERLENEANRLRLA